jgi:hypothetical protein
VTWQLHAACRGAPTDLFFPDKWDDSRPAKAICARCPVRTDCTEHAFTQPEFHGIWGGMSERQRRNIRRGGRQRRCQWCRRWFTAQGMERICSDGCRAESRADSHRRNRQAKQAGVTPTR